MAFRVHIDKSLGREMARLMREQVRHAEEALACPEDSRHGAVHEARKALKKGRATLLLLEQPLGAKRYRRENARLRRIAQMLSGARDAQAQLEAIERLLGSGHEVAALESLRRELERRLDSEAGPDTEASKAEALAALREFELRIKGWDLAGLRFDDLLPGLRRTYSRGRKAFVLAYAQPSAESFHAWRKRVKGLWYHTRLFAALWPRVMKAHAGELKRLSEQLGEDHDLALLAVTVDDIQGLDRSVRRALRRRLALESDTLRERAHPLGARLYAERPGCFAQRLERWWLIGGG